MEPSITDNELEPQGDQLQPAMHEHGGLTITTQEIISIINEILIFKGIKAALLKYEDMCYVRQDSRMEHHRTRTQQMACTGNRKSENCQTQKAESWPQTETADG